MCPSSSSRIKPPPLRLTCASLAPSLLPLCSQRLLLLLIPKNSTTSPTLPQAMASSLLGLLLFLLAAFAIASVSADRFTVGDSKGWNPNVNYTIWEEKHRPFHKGDWLVFYYQSGMADVVQVDEVGYNKCDASNPISNYSKGRSYAFELNETKRYYFICSYGYCYGGMRLSVRAQALPPPSPPPSTKSGTTPSFRSVTNGVALAVSAVVFAALLL